MARAAFLAVDGHARGDGDVEVCKGVSELHDEVPNESN